MPPPHINAQPGDFAETVLMPGDPQRAEQIASTYFNEARRVTDVRNAWGYTGLYKGHRLSVMAHGMGIPSCSIYATELIREYGVKTLIRVGSCGALAADIRLGDVVRALEGPIALADRADPAGRRNRHAPDGRTETDAVFKDLSARIEACFDEVSVADLCEKAVALGIHRPQARERYVYVI